MSQEIIRSSQRDRQNPAHRENCHNTEKYRPGKNSYLNTFCAVPTSEQDIDTAVLETIRSGSQSEN